MALEIGPGSYVSFASNAVDTLSRVRGDRAAGGVALPVLRTDAAFDITNQARAGPTLGRPENVSPGRFAETRLRLDRTDTALLLRRAVTAATGITSALRDLRAGLRIAGHDGLVSSNAAVLDNRASRVSVINFSAQAGILLDRIDDLVAASAVGSANLLSGAGPNVRLQTTRFNGGLNVVPQPLDTAGLGLDDLNLTANGGVDDAVAKVERAIYSAEDRLQRLRFLQQAVDGTTVTSQELARAVGGFGASSPARGALVDLIG